MKRTLGGEKYTENDCRKLFESSTEELRWLCYTLTGDRELSDKALHVALEQSLKGAGQVFREWMLSWARRLIIKFCITTMRPAASSVGHLYSFQMVELGSVSSDQLEVALSLSSEVLQQKLLRLDTLARFVFVLRALEGYSRRDTALLLNLDDRSCERLYYQAMTEIQPNVYVMKPLATGMELVSAY